MELCENCKQTHTGCFLMCKLNMRWSECTGCRGKGVKCVNNGVVT